MITIFLASAQDIFGPIYPPPGISNWIGQGGQGAVPGLIPFLNAILKLVIIFAGLFAFFNIIIAGFQFMTAGGDPKNVEKAWTKIWQSLLGLVIVAGSFVLAALIGWLLFQDATAILKPKIYIPGGFI